MPEPLDRAVVHYALNDPRVVRGGVETFALTLRKFFREVLYMTPATRDEALVRERRLPVICDNHWVLDWPEGIPVIGFQHGVARVKFEAIGDRETGELGRRQARAARRPNTHWVACARWISEKSGALYGNRAASVIYHPVDLELFDGVRHAEGSRLIIHDGRTPHKGSHIYPWLAAKLDGYRFESLDVPREQVPARLAQAAAFLHLSSYEGNSVMCTEAMAMNLPCLFTRVGLLLDGLPLDVWSVPREIGRAHV